MTRKVGVVLLLLYSTALAAPSKVDSLLLPGNSPLVTFRLLFTTGSAFDPPGKEGRAWADKVRLAVSR